jgi:type I restriction enzyme S subunit
VQLGKAISERARTGDSPIPYLRNANVQWNRLDLDDVANMAFSEPERTKFALRYGDILACEARHVGKSAIWREEIPGAGYQNALHRIRAIGDDHPEYLLHCMYYLSITGRFIARTGVTTIPHLPAERLRAMPFPFPSVEEQRDIANAIDDFDRSLKEVQRRTASARQRMLSVFDQVVR